MKPDIPLRPLTNAEIAGRIAETIQWEDTAPHEWTRERYEQFVGEVTSVLDGAQIAASAPGTTPEPNDHE